MIASLQEACFAGDSEIVADLVDTDHGDVDVNQRYGGNRTALIYVAENAGPRRRGGLATIQTLVDRGADIDLKDCDGHSALSYAAFNGHLQVAEYLLEQKADVNVRDAQGATPLLVVSQIGTNKAMIALLRRYGADGSIARTSGGPTADDYLSRAPRRSEQPHEP